MTLRRFNVVLFLSLWCAVFAVPVTHAQLVRVPNTSLTNLPAQPPQFGYIVTNAFPTVSLSQPLCLATPPGETNRLFILEKTGSIVVISNLANPTRTVFMSLPVLTDSESGLLGLAFHPGYATNRYFYVFSSRTQTTGQGTGRHQVISRFQTTATNANVALTNTEQFLIRQFDNAGNHNGGDLHFGPDGYLYASVGDEGFQYNGNTNAQIITNRFFSAILRLDVDKRPGNPLPNPHGASSTNYAIPINNPYVGVTNFNGFTFAATNVRTEFFSIGYRNPWRFSFDELTGDLYVGDVGQDQYEEVSVITNGANAGWSYYEGNHLARPLYPSQQYVLTNPPAGLVFPIQEYPHSGTVNYVGNAVTGGVVYRGSRLSQLYGAYVFGDNGSGSIWMLRYNNGVVTPFQYLLTASGGPAAFGTDPRNGDILIAQVSGGQILRLDYTNASTGAALPATLAGTGAFTDLTNLVPAAGIVPYELNVPFWSDNAIKTRWFSVPNTNLTLGFSTTNNWTFPTGTVWIKHFELELTNGVPASRKRLETRFIVRNNAGVYGITYRWNSATNAVLVPEAGTNETLVINEGGILRTQVWRYPSRSECLACHTVAGGYGLGFNTAQLNRNQTYGALTTNQLRALSAAGYFSQTLTNSPDALFALAHGTNTAYSLEYRARSFLAANCSQCHQPGGSAQRAAWDARIATPTAQANLLNAVPVNDLGNASNAVVKPRSPTASVLLTRLAARDLGAPGSLQMPPLGTSVTNTAAVQLVTDWINALPTNGVPMAPQLNPPVRSGSNLVFAVNSGWPGQTFQMQSTTNILQPRDNWLSLATNTLNAGGIFTLTNPFNPGSSAIFYMLKVP